MKLKNSRLFITASSPGFFKLKRALTFITVKHFYLNNYTAMTINSSKISDIFYIYCNKTIYFQFIYIENSIFLCMIYK